MKAYARCSDGLMPAPKSTRLRNASSVPCPECGASAGFPCAGRHYTHQARVDAWKEAKAEKAKGRKR